MLDDVSVRVLDLAAAERFCDAMTKALGAGIAAHEGALTGTAKR